MLPFNYNISDQFRFLFQNESYFFSTLNQNLTLIRNPKKIVKHLFFLEVVFRQMQIFHTYNKSFMRLGTQIWAITFVLLLLTSEWGAKCEAEKIPFVAEVGRLMDIIINSLYTQKEVFLRELISNASDALDKIKFLSYSDKSILGDETELEIKIQYDDDRKIVEIIDNGIGMTKSQLITNLGTVAKSGTTKFLENLKAGDINLIGQFGVGFYSSFLVASKVEVISKHNEDSQHRWTSSASNIFTVEPDDSIKLKRGTLVRLYLKEDASEYCQYEELKRLIERYSAFINYPIYLKKIVTSEEKVEKTQAEIDAEIEKVTEQWREEGKEIDEEEIENSVNRTTTKTVETVKFERINENRPLWTRSRADISKEQYREFYKNVFKDTSNPLSWSHFSAEGDVDFTGLIFIPERAPYDQFEKFYEKKSEVKLYVRKVLVNDEFEDLLPKYLNFLKTLVDSDSLPLNVARQNLQHDKALKSIGKKLLNKAIDLLVSFNPSPEDEEQLFSEDEDQAEQSDGEFTSAYEKKVDTFNKFWKNFQKNIKLGIIEDHQNRNKLAVLTRWYTTNNITQLTSLDDYISRMKEGQKHIYFLGGEQKAVMYFSPLIEKLVKEKYQVILGDDPLDETLFSTFKEYKSYKIVNVARTDFKEPYKTDELRKEVKYLKKVYTPLIEYAQNQLKDYIKEVRVSLRLVEEPVVIVADMMNDTPNRERLEAAASMKANTKYHKEKNILEINPHAPIIQQLNKIVEEEPDQSSSKLIKNLYYAALIHSGFLVKDPHYFSKNVFDLINTAFGVKEQVSEIEVTDEDLETLEPAVTTTETETPQGVEVNHDINLDDENIKIVGGSEAETEGEAEEGTEQSLEL